MSGSPAGGSQLAPSATAWPNGEVLALGLRHDRRVHLLDVHVADAVRVAADELDVVRPPVGEVAGVQAQVDVAGVGVVQEPLDLRLGLDVAVGVRVELQLHAVLLGHVRPSSSADRTSVRPLRPSSSSAGSR